MDTPNLGGLKSEFRRLRERLRDVASEIASLEEEKAKIEGTIKKIEGIVLVRLEEEKSMIEEEIRAIQGSSERTMITGSDHRSSVLKKENLRWSVSRFPLTVR